MSSKTTLHPRPRPFVSFPDELVPVRIIRRRNRFVIETAKDPLISLKADATGKEHATRLDERRANFTPEELLEPLTLHMPNTGRMEELLVPGTVGLAAPDGGGERKTAGTLLLVRYAGRWVSVDARMPNRLLEQCLIDKFLPPFRHYDEWRAEAPLGKGRIDFKLTHPKRPDYLIETKSCNLVEGGLALFPDAPTERGARHLNELADAVRAGHKAAVVWFVQRDDATRLAPHHVADPTFAQSLHDARKAGVAAHAYRCRVSPEGIEVLDDIPVLDPYDGDEL